MTAYVIVHDFEILKGS